MHKILAQGQFGSVNNPFSTLGGPAALTGSTNGTGLFAILNVFFRLAIVLAGLYTLLNFVLAGYGFINAGGDPKNIANAWKKIWQSLVGLLVVAGSLVLAVLIGWLIFGNANPRFLINPVIYTP